MKKLQGLAAEKNANAIELAFAWVLSRGQNIFPLIGAKTLEQLNEGLASETVKLSTDDLSKLDSWFPSDAIAGTRYPEPAMAMLKG